MGRRRSAKASHAQVVVARRSTPPARPHPGARPRPTAARSPETSRDTGPATAGTAAGADRPPTSAVRPGSASAPPGQPPDAASSLTRQDGDHGPGPGVGGHPLVGRPTPLADCPVWTVGDRGQAWPSAGRGGCRSMTSVPWMPRRRACRPNRIGTTPSRSRCGRIYPSSSGSPDRLAPADCSIEPANRSGHMPQRSQPRTIVALWSDSRADRVRRRAPLAGVSGPPH